LASSFLNRIVFGILSSGPIILIVAITSAFLDAVPRGFSLKPGEERAAKTGGG
jgi:hypothetical protein